MYFIGLIVLKTFLGLPMVKPEDVKDTVTIYQDYGSSVRISCPNKPSDINFTNWIVSGNVGKPRSQNSAVLDDGSLFISNLTKSDSHLYKCQDAETNQSLGSVKLIVRSVPPSVNNLTIITHSVYALITWELYGNGGYPISKFLLKYRQVTNSPKLEWNIIDDIQPNASSVTVYQLEPNTTYFFRIQAFNKLGAGHEVTVMAKTKFNLKEINKAKELQVKDENSTTNIYMKVTIVAIGLVVVTFAILSLGISLVLFRHCGKNVHTELQNCEATEEEVLELVPHITLNPSFNIDMLEYIEAEVSPTDACERTSLVPTSHETESKTLIG